MTTTQILLLLLKALPALGEGSLSLPVRIPASSSPPPPPPPQQHCWLKPRSNHIEGFCGLDIGTIMILINSQVLGCGPAMSYQSQPATDTMPPPLPILDPLLGGRPCYSCFCIYTNSHLCAAPLVLEFVLVRLAGSFAPCPTPEAGTGCDNGCHFP